MKRDLSTIAVLRAHAHALAWRLRALLTRRRGELELDEEMRSHLALLEEEHRCRGLSAVEARYAALRDFGGVEQVRESCRDLRRVPLIELAASDVRFAWRSLRRHRAFAATAVSTLALGIGASTATYTVLREAVLAPLPTRNVAGLVWVANAWEGALGRMMDVEYQAWQPKSRSFTRTALYGTREVTLTVGAPAERVLCGAVSAGFFSALGVTPALGREILTGEDQPGRERIAVLSDALWRRRFRADPAAVGRIVVLDGHGHEIVGVLPAGYRFLEREQPAIFIPHVLPSVRPEDGLSVAQVNVLGWLRPGVTPAQAESELATILEGSRSDYPLSALSYPFGTARPHVRVAGAREWRSALVGTAPFALAAAVAVLLLLACTTVASLQLGRLLERRQELAVRAALGAGRMRLMRQMLTEAGLLASMGGALALALAWAMLQGARSLAPESLAYVREARLEPAAIAFAFVVAAVTTLLSGTIPALVAMGGSTSAIQRGAPRRTQSRGARRWGAALVALTLALSVVLLAATGLLVTSLVRVTSLDYGIRPAGLLALRVGLPSGRYGTRDAVRATSDQLLSELRALPGVLDATLSDVGPLGYCRGYPVETEGRATATGETGTQKSVCEESVSWSYLRQLGVEVRAGRMFRQDDASGPALALINESARKALFGGDDAIGARVRTRGQWLTVVGVVADVRSSRSEAVKPTLYQLFAQPASTMMNNAGAMERSRGQGLAAAALPTATEVTFVLSVHPGLDPRSLATATRRRVAQLDDDLSVYDVATVAERLASTVSADRFLTVLVGALALTAQVLAFVGVYGVTRFAVARRTAEIGLRLALGATPRGVLALVLGEAAWLSGGAVLGGVLAALGVRRFLSAVLYETSRADLLALPAVGAVVFVSALMAAWIPARRAACVDPAVTLRCE